MRCKLPVYDYECNECSAKFEQRQSFDDDPVAICPKCGQKARRVFHSVPILFKGKGFYSTDHGKGVTNNVPPKDKGSESESEAGTDTEKKTESGTTIKSEVEAKVGESS